MGVGVLVATPHGRCDTCIHMCQLLSRRHLLLAGMCCCCWCCRLLLPEGAEHSCYTADISRTFPACGTFTPQQRDIYDVVLHMQQHALDALKVRAGFKVLC